MLVHVLMPDVYLSFQIKSRLSLLRIQEQRLSGVFGEWQKIAAEKMNQAQVRIQEAENRVAM